MAEKNLLIETLYGTQHLDVASGSCDKIDDNTRPREASSHAGGNARGDGESVEPIHWRYKPTDVRILPLPSASLSKVQPTD